MRVFAAIVLSGLTLPALAAEGTGPAVVIDGRIDPAEWAGALHVGDFRQVQPLTRAPASQPTEAWVLATPAGLAVGFRNVQPAGVPRTRQYVRRDFKDQVDRVNLYVDFGGEGRTGYNFTVASTGGIADGLLGVSGNFSSDWDGSWRHAVSEDAEGWSAEMLIPWHIAPTREGEDGRRKLKICLDRVIGSSGERAAWPAVSFEQPRFLAEFSPLEVTAYKQSLLALTPYVSGLYDNVDGHGDFDAGADLFWKPSGQFQLAATLNPDFGQVESDDLVVNFDATEVFISEKRPFFTENQGIFEYGTPSDFSQLLYTRRVGGPADDGKGAGDIVAALKLNGSVGRVQYGLFAADEADEAGRRFYAGRVTGDFGSQNLGLMMTRVERPWLDREATVLGVDHNWRPGQRWNVQTRVFGSRIDQDGASVRDLGGSLWVDYEMGHGWRQQWIAMHFGDELQINDAGYLSRNNLNYLHWELRRRFTDLPDESRYASKEWRWRASGIRNDHGQVLNDQFRVIRKGQLRDGSEDYAQVNLNSAGHGDLITRGHGAMKKPANFNAHYEYSRPRKGDWAWKAEFNLHSHGVERSDRIGFDFWLQPTYFINDAFSVYAGLLYERTPDWLVWQRDNLIGSFDEEAIQLDAGMNLAIGSKQELRVKTQAIGMDAALRQAWRVQPNGAMAKSADAIDSFSLRTLGFQIRYRYELAPLSYLYVVYGRGGYRQDAFSEDPASQLQDSLRLRDDEQLVVKFSYRFEL